MVLVSLRCLILCSKFAKNRLSAGFRPDPLGGGLQRSPDTLAGSWRKGVERVEGKAGEERRGREKGNEKKRKGEGKGRESRDGEGYPPNENPGYGPRFGTCGDH